jgi:signal transduction histidine kinase
METQHGKRNGRMNAPFVVSLVSAVRALLASLRTPGGALTLDRLRSDLSHETAAKLARLQGLVREWQAGNFRPSDPSDMLGILRDVRKILLRHARLSAGRLDTLVHLSRALSAVELTSQHVTKLPAAVAPSTATVEILDALTGRLRRATATLVESLSLRQGTRLVELLASAVAEVNREAGSGKPGVPPITLEGTEVAAGIWVSRQDGPRWADVFRNLLRNSVQATMDRMGATVGEAPGGVIARLRRMPEAPGITLEILDEGVGMTPELVAQMWRSGKSSHGPRRGHGLTEAKFAFITRHGACEVRSMPGAGTCVRLDLPDRDLRIRPPRIWALPPVVACLALITGTGLLLTVAMLGERPVSSVSIDKARRTIRAIDSRGKEVWQRVMDEEILFNWRVPTYHNDGRVHPVVQDLVLPPTATGGSGVIVATRPPEGPARIWRLGPHGAPQWERLLRWNAPNNPHTGQLKAVFIVLTPWNRPQSEAVVVNVRDSDYSSSSLQFFTTRGDSLGAYYHPGHLEFEASGDFDHDGRTEILVRVFNNGASQDPSLGPGDTKGYPCGLAMLEPPNVSGQAYPYANWTGMPKAREEGYLLIPPLRSGPPYVIVRVDAGQNLDVSMYDGRIYHLDSHLRPRSCGVGDFTTADTLAPVLTPPPLLYIHQGVVERFRIPVLKGTG